MVLCVEVFLPGFREGFGLDLSWSGMRMHITIIKL